MHYTNSVNPIYYVFFTTAVLCASFVLFQGFNTTNAVNTISLICGFVVIFLGTHLLNDSESRKHERHNASSSSSGLHSKDLGEDGHGRHRPLRQRSSIDEDEERGVPTDPIADIATRYSMHSRRSSDVQNHRRSLSGSVIFSAVGGVRAGSGFAAGRLSAEGERLMGGGGGGRRSMDGGPRRGGSGPGDGGGGGASGLASSSSAAAAAATSVAHGLEGENVFGLTDLTEEEEPAENGSNSQLVGGGGEGANGQPVGTKYANGNNYHASPRPGPGPGR
jgi:Magnesium transporter NIPA